MISVGMESEKDRSAELPAIMYHGQSRTLFTDAVGYYVYIAKGAALRAGFDGRTVLDLDLGFPGEVFLKRNGGPSTMGKGWSVQG